MGLFDKIINGVAVMVTSGGVNPTNNKIDETDIWIDYGVVRKNTTEHDITDGMSALDIMDLLDIKKQRTLKLKKLLNDNVGFYSNVVDYSEIIIKNPCNEPYISMVIPKNRAALGGGSMKYPSSHTFYFTRTEYEIGDFVKLIGSKFETLMNYDNHILVIKSLGTYENIGYLSGNIKLLDLTLKEQTGFDYCISVNKYNIKKDLKAERIYKLKNIINGNSKIHRNTNVQEQTKQDVQSRGQRVLALPFSCD